MLLSNCGEIIVPHHILVVWILVAIETISKKLPHKHSPGLYVHCSIEHLNTLVINSCKSNPIRQSNNLVIYAEQECCSKKMWYKTAPTHYKGKVKSNHETVKYNCSSKNDELSPLSNIYPLIWKHYSLVEAQKRLEKKSNRKKHFITLAHQFRPSPNENQSAKKPDSSALDVKTGEDGDILTKATVIRVTSHCEGE